MITEKHARTGGTGCGFPSLTRKKILVLFIIAVLFSCTEDNTTVTRTKQQQLALDIDRIKGYIEENNLSGFESLENGLHYKTLELGNQKYPA